MTRVKERNGGKVSGSRRGAKREVAVERRRETDKEERGPSRFSLWDKEP